MTFEEINKALDNGITVYFAYSKYVVHRDLYGKLSIKSIKTGNSMDIEEAEYEDCFID